MMVEQEQGKARTKQAQREVDSLTDYQVGLVIDIYLEEGYEAVLEEFGLSRDALDFILSDVR